MRYENLSVWEKAYRLSVEIYKYFKLSKDYGFKEQSNIAQEEEKNYLKAKADKKSNLNPKLLTLSTNLL